MAESKKIKLALYHANYLLLPRPKLQDQSTKAYNLVNKTKIKSPLFGTHFIKFSKTVSYKVNLTSQCSHREALLVRKENFDFV